MSRAVNTLLHVALVLVLCAFVAWLARADSLRREYVIAGGFLGGVGSGLIMALLVQRQRCRQVLLNLVLNGCCKAMAALTLEHRQLGVRTRQVSTHKVEVAVHDGGVGLDEDKLEQIFEPFYTTKPTGMGMGLAICHSILTAHGGRLWAANNPDRGATFSFTVPVHEAEP